MVHCWKDYRSHLEETGGIYSDEWVETYYGGNATCMREAGHSGEHEFMPDENIVVQFAGEQESL